MVLNYISVAIDNYDNEIANEMIENMRVGARWTLRLLVINIIGIFIVNLALIKIMS